MTLNHDCELVKFQRILFRKNLKTDFFTQIIHPVQLAVIGSKPSCVLTVYSYREKIDDNQSDMSSLYVMLSLMN